MLRETASGELSEDEDVEEDLFDPLDQLADLPKDMTFAEWLASSDVPKEQHAALRSYVEGFNAADANRISALSLGLQQKAEDLIEGDRAWHLRGGYSQLAIYLANRVRKLGGEIRLGIVVQSVRWSAGGVVVETKQRSVSCFAMRRDVTAGRSAMRQSASEAYGLSRNRQQ